MTVELIWKKICLNPIEVNLSKVLRCGQAFRWKNVNNIWSFSSKDRVIFLRQDDEFIHYAWLMSAKSKYMNISVEGQSQETLEFISDYFNLSINLEELYTQWIEHDKVFRKSNSKSSFSKLTGIRILRQDPWETLISFICSSNNNVKRISKMCEAICLEFGEYINEYEGVPYYAFPTPEALSDSSVETRLRELGFGYRAKYINQTAKMITDMKLHPEISIDSLNGLRDQDYEYTHDYLLQFSGVGPKVADCICLMALDKHEVVPIDTHVYQIAVRDYKFKGSKDIKTLNKKIYLDIRLFFKEIFGPFAGWAQSVLFADDLSDLNNGINEISEPKPTVNESLKVKKEALTTSDFDVIRPKRQKV